MGSLKSQAGSELPEGENHSFGVEFQGLGEIRFQNCTGLEFSIQPVLYKDGGFSGAPRTARGSILTSEISFQYGTLASGSLNDWFFQVMDLQAKLDKRVGRISLRSSDDRIVAQWELLNAWPCRWTGPLLSTVEHGLAIDSISFVHEGIRRLK